MDGNVKKAKECGYAVTMTGRKRYIREINSSNYNLRQFGERAAMNMPLQGSAADIIKIAMINVYTRLKKENLKSKLILQVHDELIVDAFKDEAEKVKKIVKEEMENAVKLSVPLTVSLSEAENWYDCKKKIAVTGGIGSGKSTVTKIISDLGYPTYSADEIYAEIISDPAVIKKASALLGINVFYKDGKSVFDRKEAAKVTFSDKARKKLLENYVHPLVYEKIDEIFKNSKTTTFFEIPLLFETERQDDFDCVLLVEREEKTRVEAVKKRSGLTEEEVYARIKNQFDYKNCEAKNLITIHNDGDLKNLEKAVRECVEEICKKNN